MSVKSAALKVGMVPIARTDAQLFVLGSLPGDASLAAQRYYAHPTNQFWLLLGGAIGEDLQTLPYEQRLKRLAARKIGLWDVIASASRKGSLDQAIREVAHNQIEHLLHGYPALKAIAFNGGTAATLGRKLIGNAAPHLALIDLPSSSAAYTKPLAEKAVRWSVLGNFL